jgi:hypothetical protein
MAFNESEAKLGRFSKNTFLTMWSYENPFYQHGKELCDVLVVFGDDLIIISDKLIKFKTHEDPSVCWRRWYKKAVHQSVSQLLGAKNKIERMPNSVFINAELTIPLPLKLPPPDRMKIHLLAVANGSDDAYELFPDRPNLRIDTQCRDGSEPMTVGTFSQDDNFVHVVSRAAIDALFECFDTTRDFIDYLERKQNALQSSDWFIDGEENLIASYMLSQPGNQPYSIPTTKFPLVLNARFVENKIWMGYKSSSIKNIRDENQKQSRTIDNIIEHIAEEYLDNKLIIGQEKSLSYHENAFRLLAAESRLGRQLIALSLYDILDEPADTFWGSMVESLDYPGIFYVWLLYPEFPVDVTDSKLEFILLDQLSKYIIVARSKFSHARRVFGICLPRRNNSRTSMLFRILDGEDWTDEDQQYAEYISKTEGIFSNVISTEKYASR